MKTDKQLIARGRFAGCNRFYDLLRFVLLRHIWKIAAIGTGKNAKNLFVQQNLYAFGKDREVTDYERLYLSTGLLPLPGGLRIVRYNNCDCLLQWKYDAREAIGSPDDLLYIVEIQASFEKKKIHETGIKRSESKAVFSTYDNIDEQTHLYCFWGNEQSTSFSTSHHFGCIPLVQP